MKTILVMAALSASVLMSLATPLFAATCTASASGVMLGTYTPNQRTPADSAGSIVVTCAKGALDALPMTVNYSLDISIGSSTGYSPREMTSGVNRLRYNLYRDATRISIWGDGSGGTSAVAGALAIQPSPGSASFTHTLYGRIFASQNAVPGSYADTVLVTVSY
ncbi:MAG: spore coat U domain-containing protein [Betaproteobacteria bacterium]